MKIMKVGIVCALFLSAAPSVFAETGRSAGTVDFSSAAYAASAALPSELVAGFRGTVIPVSYDQVLYLKEGDRVDVLVTFEALMGKKGETSKELVTATIVQNVAVLGVRRPDRKEDPGAVELLCNPVEAQYIALSVPQSKKINLVVRAPGDTEPHAMDIASFRKLIK